MSWGNDDRNRLRNIPCGMKFAIWIKSWTFCRVNNRRWNVYRFVGNVCNRRSLAWPTVHNRKRREHNKRLLDRHMRYFRNVLLTLVINTIPHIVSDSFYCGVCVFEWSDCCAMTENLIKIRLFWKAFNYKTENPFQWIVGCWTPHAIMQWWWLWEKQIILFPFGELCHFTLCWWRPELSYGLFCHQIFDGRARICCAFDAFFYFGT